MAEETVLITGAPGWLGTRLAEAVTQGYEGKGEPLEPDWKVRCLVQPGLDAAVLRELGPRVEIVEGDLRDRGALDRACSGAGIVFHIAGVVHPKKRIRELYEANVEGTKNLLAAATEKGVRRFIAVSSNSPAGVNPSRDHLFTEESPYRPYMNYGRSKMLMELAVREAEAAGKLETVILRPCWFYGPRQPERQTTFFRMIKSGKPPLFGDGENKRSMSYVDNTCQALLLAARSEKARGKTYWIADRRPYTMNEIYKTIARLLGVEEKLKPRKLPGFASGLCYIADRMIQGLGFYHQKIHVASEMNKTIACSVELAERELGYDPKVELEEGMRRSIEWCRTRGIDI